MKFIDRFKIFSCAIWAIPAVFLIRILEKLILIRLGTFRAERIGHFVLDGEEQRLRLKEQSYNTVDLFWMHDFVSNKQWSKMLKRSMPIYSFVRYIDLWNRFIPGGEKHQRPSTYTGSRDINGLFYKGYGNIPFLESENIKAKKWLYSKGWCDGEPFICLLVRDAAYLKNCGIHDNKKDWSYHNYRDSDIETYKKAIEWLSEQGIWVLRMGKIMREPISFSNPRVVDYAFCDEKSDLLDIWLFANCTGCISTSTGIDAVSQIYRKPILFVNSSFDFRTYTISTYAPKRLQWANNSSDLTFKECLDNSYGSMTEFTVNGIEVISLTDNEIFGLVQEFWLRINDKWVESSEGVLIQHKAFDTLKSKNNFKSLCGWIHPEFRIGNVWVNSYKDDFF